MKLTEAKCRAAKPAEKAYKLSDGKQLYLFVKPNRAKLWRMDCKIAGKRKTLSFGPYPDISLADARRRAENARRENRGLSDVSVGGANVRFRDIAEDWWRIQCPKWSERHRSIVHKRLVRDVYPYIGDMAIRDIDAPRILELIRKIEGRGALEVSQKVKQTIGQVFRYAVGLRRAERDPTSDLKGLLIPKPRVVQHSHIKPVEVPDFYEALAGCASELRGRHQRAGVTTPF